MIRGVLRCRSPRYGSYQSHQSVQNRALPQDWLSGIEADAAKSAEVGEPWLSRFDPNDLALLLLCIGFSEVVSP